MQINYFYLYFGGKGKICCMYCFKSKNSTMKKILLLSIYALSALFTYAQKLELFLLDSTEVDLNGKGKIMVEFQKRNRNLVQSNKDGETFRKSAFKFEISSGQINNLGEFSFDFKEVLKREGKISIKVTHLPLKNNISQTLEYQLKTPKKIFPNAPVGELMPGKKTQFFPVFYFDNYGWVYSQMNPKLLDYVEFESSTGMLVNNKNEFFIPINCMEDSFDIHCNFNFKVNKENRSFNKNYKINYGISVLVEDKGWAGRVGYGGRDGRSGCAGQNGTDGEDGEWGGNGGNGGTVLVDITQIKDGEFLCKVESAKSNRSYRIDFANGGTLNFDLQGGTGGAGGVGGDGGRGGDGTAARKDQNGKLISCGRPAGLGGNGGRGGIGGTGGNGGHLKIIADSSFLSYTNSVSCENSGGAGGAGGKGGRYGKEGYTPSEPSESKSGCLTAIDLAASIGSLISYRNNSGSEGSNGMTGLQTEIILKKHH